jgi:hypothetical protein
VIVNTSVNKYGNKSYISPSTVRISALDSPNLSSSR